MCADSSMNNQSPRPLLRGYSHLLAAGVAIVGLIGLLILADSVEAAIAGAIFATSLTALYLTSGTYHAINWGRRMKAVLQRLDHSMIFVLIAGTYTPFCLLAANGVWGVTVLIVIWSIAIAGIILKTVWPGAPRWLSVGLYVTAGWLGVVAGLPMSDWFALVPLVLLVLGGILYTIGGVIYGLRRPDPFPRVFGYHEVFHVLVIAGSALHYTLIAAYLMPA
jgi:hemolysin III